MHDTVKEEPEFDGDLRTLKCQKCEMSAETEQNRLKQEAMHVTGNRDVRVGFTKAYQVPETVPHQAMDDVCPAGLGKDSKMSLE